MAIQRGGAGMMHPTVWETPTDELHPNCWKAMWMCKLSLGLQAPKLSLYQAAAARGLLHGKVLPCNPECFLLKSGKEGDSSFHFRIWREQHLTLMPCWRGGFSWQALAQHAVWVVHAALQAQGWGTKLPALLRAPPQPSEVRECVPSFSTNNNNNPETKSSQVLQETRKIGVGTERYSQVLAFWVCVY